jgi:hypothetical protein
LRTPRPICCGSSTPSGRRRRQPGSTWWRTPWAGSSAAACCRRSCPISAAHRRTAWTKLFTYGTPHGGITFDVGLGVVERLRDAIGKYLTPKAVLARQPEPPHGWSAREMPDGLMCFKDHLEQTADFSDTLIVGIGTNETGRPGVWADWNSVIAGMTATTGPPERRAPPTPRNRAAECGGSTSP